MQCDRSAHTACRTAVNKGSHSGSEKIVKENFDLLNEIWGGSPATSTVSFGIDSDVVEETVQNEEDLEVQGIIVTTNHINDIL